MIAKPPHNKKLGLVGISLTKERLHPQALTALTLVRDQIEPLLSSSGFLNEAPFSWVTVSVRFGLENQEEPHFQPINKKYGDLPLSIEVDTHEVRSASINELIQIFKTAVLKALIEAGRKYQRPVKILERMLAEIA